MQPSQERLKEVVEVFKASTESVKQMASFDRFVLEITIGQLRTLHSRLTEDHGIGNPRLTVEKTLKTIENIRKNDSLRPQYEEMFNQCAVLLVSHFTAALGDLFKHGVPIALESGLGSKLASEDIKLTITKIHKLRNDATFEPGDLIMRSKNLSFQDMKSTCRAFQEWVGIDIPKDTHMNNVIIGQAARHAIVHTGGIIDVKLLAQVESAILDATLDLPLESGSRVQFTPELVTDLGLSIPLCQYE